MIHFEDYEREALKDRIYLMEEAYLIEKTLINPKKLGSSKKGSKFVKKQYYAGRIKLSRAIRNSKRRIPVQYFN